MRALAISLWALLSVPAFATDPVAVAARAGDALRRDDPRALTPLLLTDERDPRAAIDLIEVIDRYDCIDVRRFETSVLSISEERAVLQIDLDASAALKAARVPVERLPRWWRIELERRGAEWKIARAMTEERRVALEMIAAPSRADADCIFTEALPRLDPLRIVREFTDEWVHRLDTGHGEHARALARALGDPSVEVHVARNQAYLPARTRDRRAVEMAREAIALAEARGSRDDVAAARFTLGMTYYIMGEQATARPHLLEAADMVDEVDDPLLPMKSLYMACFVDNHYGDRFSSLRLAEKLGALSRRFRWEEGAQLVLFVRGRLHIDFNNFDAAFGVYEEIARIGREVGNARFESMGLGNLASVEIARGRYAESVKYLRQAIPLSPETAATATLYVLLAETLLELGRHDEAAAAMADVGREVALVSDQDSREDLEVRLLELQSILHLRRGDPVRAIDAARVAVARIDQPDDIYTTYRYAQTLATLGAALRAGGLTNEAIATFQAAVAATESGREETTKNPLTRVGVLADKTRRYEHLLELLVERGSVEEAFRVSEQMKARALREIIAAGHVDVSVSMSPEDRAREESIEKRLTELNRAVIAALRHGRPAGDLERRLAETRRELDAHRLEIGVKYPTRGRRQVEAPEIAELPDDSGPLAVVEYAVCETQTLAFIVTRDAGGAQTIEVVRIPIGRKQLERETSYFNEIISRRSVRYSEGARRLYALLFEPVARRVRGKALCIIPDGPLWHVPFHALIAPDGRDLLDHHVIFYAHSIALLRNATPPLSAPPTLIAFGNPTAGSGVRSTFRSLYRDVELGPLPEAEDEVRSLSAMYSPERSRAYWRGAAREAVFKQHAENYDVIHIAAHALVNDDAPMYSAIVLAARGDESDDGLLEAREVVDLPLTADLAILSACDTARGKVGMGEGLIGIAWAFFAAGCPTTVASQWKAESDATSRLMIDFHRRLLAGGSVAEALRAAQLALRSRPEYQHPFYWAPFVAIGAGGRPLTRK